MLNYILYINNQHVLEDIIDVYKKFITQIYEEYESGWPDTIKNKVYLKIKKYQQSSSLQLLELHSAFKNKDPNLFPYTQILEIIETLNTKHEPFVHVFKNIVNSSKPLDIILEETHYWAIEFFIDKLCYSYDQILDSYSSLFRENLSKVLTDFNEQFGIALMKYHYGNCIANLILLWKDAYKKSNYDYSSFSSIDKQRKPVILNNDHAYKIRDILDDVKVSLLPLKLIIVNQNFLQFIKERPIMDEKRIILSLYWVDICQKNIEDLLRKQNESSSYLSFKSNQTSFLSAKSKKSNLPY